MARLFVVVIAVGSVFVGATDAAAYRGEGRWHDPAVPKTFTFQTKGGEHLIFGYRCMGTASCKALRAHYDNAAATYPDGEALTVHTEPYYCGQGYCRKLRVLTTRPGDVTIAMPPPQWRRVRKVRPIKHRNVGKRRVVRTSLSADLDGANAVGELEQHWDIAVDKGRRYVVLGRGLGPQATLDGVAGLKELDVTLGYGEDAVSSFVAESDLVRLRLEESFGWHGSGVDQPVRIKLVRIRERPARPRRRGHGAYIDAKVGYGVSPYIAGHGYRRLYRVDLDAGEALHIERFAAYPDHEIKVELTCTSRATGKVRTDNFNRSHGSEKGRTLLSGTQVDDADCILALGSFGGLATRRFHGVLKVVAAKAAQP